MPDMSCCRYMKRSTLDAYVAEVLGYSKLVVACLLSAADFRLGILLILEVPSSSPSTLPEASRHTIHFSS